MALSTPNRSNNDTCTQNVLLNTCIDPVEYTDQLSELKRAILNMDNDKLHDAVEQSDPVELFITYTSKPQLTRSNANELSLQACHDGQLNGFDLPVCNTCHSDGATTKLGCLSSDNQQSSLMVVGPNTYGQLKIKYHQLLEGSDAAQIFSATPIAVGKAVCYILVGNSQVNKLLYIIMVHNASMCYEFLVIAAYECSMLNIFFFW